MRLLNIKTRHQVEGQNYYTRGNYNLHRVCLLLLLLLLLPIPVAARSKAWVCGRCLAEIVGLNPAEFMDVCLL
jgi:hypothetical protein